jgi:hypothetical protein
MTPIDNAMHARARAGDSRRVLTAILYYAQGDTAALGQVLAEAREIGRAHHLTFALLEKLSDAYGLAGSPERADEIRAAILQFAAVENDNEEHDNG